MKLSKKIIRLVIFTVALTLGTVTTTNTQASSKSVLINAEKVLSHQSMGFSNGNPKYITPSSKRWATNKITYKIDTSSKYYQLIFKNAVKHWNNAKVVHLIAVKKNPDIDLKVGNATAKQGYGACGNTVRSWETGEFINGRNELIHVNCFVYENSVVHAKYHAQQREHVAEHELGHGLGLDHVKTPDAVMYPYIANNTITMTDVNGLKQLYSNNSISY